MMSKKENILNAWIKVEQLSEGNINLKEKNIHECNLKNIDWKHYFLDFMKKSCSDYNVKIEKKKYGLVLFFGIFPFEEVADILRKRYGKKASNEEVLKTQKFSITLYFDYELKLIDKNFFYTTSGYIREHNEFPKKISEEESHFLKELNSKLGEECQYFNDTLNYLIEKYGDEKRSLCYKFIKNVEYEEANLHSFFIKDLEKAKKINSDKLDFYLFGNDKEKINLESQPDSENFQPKLFETILMPNKYPNGRFPSNPDYALSFMQEVATNIAINSSAEVRTVNGPPGTGKTTLLKDIFAHYVVEQAHQICNLKNKKIQDEQQYNEKYKIGILPYEIAKDNIIVASSNNSAVQNIVKELPRIDSIYPDFLEEIKEADYFTDIANSDQLDDKKSIKEELWGTFSLEGGASSNVLKIMNTLKQISDVFDGDYQEEKSVYNDFKKMYQELMDEKKKRQDYYEDLKKIKDIKSNINFLKEEKQIEVSKFLNEIDELNVKCDTYKADVIKFEENKKIYLEKIKYLNDQVANYNKEYELLQIKKPAFLWLKKMFQTIEAKKYIEEIEIFNNKRNDCLNELSNLNQEISNNEKEKNKYQEKYDFSNSEIEKLKQKINSKEKEYNDKLTLLEMKINSLNEKIDPKDIQKLHFEVSNDELQKSNPWFDKKFRILQTKLFISALKVRKQFLYENKKSVKSAQIIWKNREEYASNKDLIVNAWQWINFTIPVISTTFASFGSMFYYMPENSISNLFIDEAGQALPQASVGAIFRSKKIMAVGDPEQIQPVLTLESGILSIIKNEYKVGDKYISPDASTQTLLDEVSPYGYYKDQDHWIGIPLWVHRRSDNPMFTISNRISYNDLMVQGKDKANGKAKWYHVEGTASNKYVKEEAEILKKLIKDKIEKNSKLKEEIFVISPFKHVANELAKELKNFDGIKFTKYDKNKKPINVGTVHTFQGKEAKIVYFVMGADFKSKGAASWAVSKPNIINVAVTRAKEEFYVIGNRKLYKSIGTNARKMIELIDQYNENK